MLPGALYSNQISILNGTYMSNHNQNLNQYQVSATDWREALRKNEKNTRNVIVLFIIIYCAVGFIIDAYFNSIQYYDQNQQVALQVPLSEILINLITFKTFPYATLIMLVVAAISLLITYYFHENLVMLGTDYIEVNPEKFENPEERQLYNVIEELKIAAGLNFMPKIFIINADYMNAFASGFSEKSAMVAITRGLLQKLDRQELQAVMAHELSHVRHNDIRLTITVALLSNLILIAIDLLFRGVLFGRGRRDNGILIVIVIARFVLPILTILLMLYLSRTRELMADTGCVELMRDNEPLARALLKIDSDHKDNSETYNKAYSNTPHEQVRNASYFYDPNYAGFASLGSINNLFSTHPSLEERLKALGIKK